MCRPRHPAHAACRIERPVWSKLGQRGAHLEEIRPRRGRGQEMQKISLRQSRRIGARQTDRQIDARAPQRRRLPSRAAARGMSAHRPQAPARQAATRQRRGAQWRPSVCADRRSSPHARRWWRDVDAMTVPPAMQWCSDAIAACARAPAGVTGSRASSPPSPAPPPSPWRGPRPPAAVACWRATCRGSCQPWPRALPRRSAGLRSGSLASSRCPPLVASVLAGRPAAFKSRPCRRSRRSSAAPWTHDGRNWLQQLRFHQRIRRISDFIAGHIAFSSLRQRYGSANYLTVLREPLSRILSHWLFWRTVPDDDLARFGAWADYVRRAREPLKDFLILQGHRLPH